MGDGLLSPEALAELRSLFDQIDTNHNGTVSKQELLECLRVNKKGVKYWLVGGRVVDRMVGDADEDGDGEISFDEFVVWYKHGDAATRNLWKRAGGALRSQRLLADDIFDRSNSTPIQTPPHEFGEPSQTHENQTPETQTPPQPTRMRPKSEALPFAKAEGAGNRFATQPKQSRSSHGSYSIVPPTQQSATPQQQPQQSTPPSQQQTTTPTPPLQPATQSPLQSTPNQAPAKTRRPTEFAFSLYSPVHNSNANIRPAKTRLSRGSHGSNAAPPKQLDLNNSNSTTTTPKPKSPRSPRLTFISRHTTISPTPPTTTTTTTTTAKTAQQQQQQMPGLQLPMSKHQQQANKSQQQQKIASHATVVGVNSPETESENNQMVAMKRNGDAVFVVPGGARFFPFGPWAAFSDVSLIALPSFSSAKDNWKSYSANYISLVLAASGYFIAQSSELWIGFILWVCVWFLCVLFSIANPTSRIFRHPFTLFSLPSVISFATAIASVILYSRSHNPNSFFVTIAVATLVCVIHSLLMRSPPPQSLHQTNNNNNHSNNNYPRGGDQRAMPFMRLEEV